MKRPERHPSKYFIPELIEDEDYNQQVVEDLSK